MFSSDALLAQNATTVEGLRTGWWQTEENLEEYYICDWYMLKDIHIAETGQYKLVPISAYDTVEPIDQAHRYVYVQYKGKKMEVKFSGIHQNTFSVKDGLWQITYNEGKMLYEAFWERGILVWEKDFNDKGEIIRQMYVDFDRKTSVRLWHNGNRVLKKEYYDSEGYQVVEWYPNDKLVIADECLVIDEPFTKIAKEEETPVIQLTCKTPIDVTGIQSEHNYVTAPFSHFPIHLKPGDTVKVALQANLTPSEPWAEIEWLTIQTSEPNAYKVPASVFMSHINGSNLGSLSTLTLSKTKDKYLVVSAMGTETDVYITDSNGHGHSCRFFLSALGFFRKIDLKDIALGKCHVHIMSCSDSGDLTLVLKE